MEASGEKAKKAHKNSVAGQKKKKARKAEGGKVERHNAKAHTFSGGHRSVEKRVRIGLEKKENKVHAPKVDKTPDVPPPFVVVIQGPPGVGKTTLIQSLVKHYAKQSLLKLNGPVTLVSGRQRRITIIECPNEMSAMLDLAKVADLVLLLIDAKFGFELETFEFINIMQVHGFPRIIGVLTHLDKFQDNKVLRKVKKQMKNRFWSELYDGAKLFHLSGLQYGRYHRLEVQNLARFIAVSRCAILSWRQSHPYVVALRWEDQTPPATAESAPRTLDVYGYVNGGRLRQGMDVHLAGVGDFSISVLKTLTDPCPQPQDVEATRQKEVGVDKDGKPKKKNALRTLAERHRLVYAPGSDVGSVTVDNDAMYIQIPNHQAGFTRLEGENEDPNGRQLPEAVRMVRELQGSDAVLNRVAEGRLGLRLLGDATTRLSEDIAPMDEAEKPARKRRLAPSANAALDDGEADDEDGADSGADEASGDEDSEEEEDDAADVEEDDDEQAATESQNTKERARLRFARAPRLEEVIYGTGSSRSSKTPAGEGSDIVKVSSTDHATVPLFDDDEEDDQALQAKVTGGLLGNLGDLDKEDSNRMPILPGEHDPWDEERIEGLKERKFITGGWSSAEEDGDAEGEAKPSDQADTPEGAEGQELALPALKTGTSGLAAGDVFTDGAPIAAFVRLRLENVPAACVAEMRRDRILIVGGLLPGETRMGLTQTRVKRHRWHQKVMKSGDALLLSVGWRRFQTVPTFSLEDRGEKRMRYLKYTLEHAHCTMTSYGPMVPPNTGVMAFRSWNKVGNFRVAATGGVLEAAPDFAIMKKLKLTGEPYKVFRNTAFIKGMFNSDLEVSKYMHTKLQTVSGIRGEIKKPEGLKGCFRATFEDRILMSDMVVCKCWIKVAPKEFYHPVVDVKDWRPARLIGELRANLGVAVPDNKDSHYGKQLVRPDRKFNTLKIPKSLEVSLPFKTKPKQDKKKRKNPLRSKTAIVSSDRERDINRLMQRLQTVKKEKLRIRVKANTKRKDKKKQLEKFIQDRRDEHTKETKKKRYIKEGNEEKQKRKSMRLD